LPDLNSTVDVIGYSQEASMSSQPKIYDTTDSLLSWLQARLYEVAGIEPEEIDPKAPFDRYGLGSIEALSLVGQLEEWLGCTLPSTLLWDYPNFEALSEYIYGLEIPRNGNSGGRHSVQAPNEPLFGNSRLITPDMFAHELVEATAREKSDLISVSHNGHMISYGELNSRAKCLAVRLRKLGVAPETIIPVLMDRSIDLLVVMLALFKEGAVYFPVDPLYPPRRVYQVIKQSKGMLILATHVFEAVLEESLRDFDDSERPEVLMVDAFDYSEKIEGPAPLADLRNLSYVIYTSGSTGMPKGSMIEHRGMSNHLSAKVNDLRMNSNDRVAQNASQSFDISVWQLLSPLICGASLLIADSDVSRDVARLLSFIENEQISILEIVPSQLRALLRHLEVLDDALPTLPSLRWVLVTGEAFPADLCRDWLELYPSIPMVNAYGPTECSDDITHFFAFEPPADSVFQVPIGKAVQGMQLYVLDKDFRQLPPGSEGELYAGGVGVGRGYLHDPEQTAQVFLPSPYSSDPGERLYKTGDLVMALPDGNLQFLGRMDNQVKVRGIRMELSEIGAGIASHARVRDVVVVAREDIPNEKRLVAYVVYDSIPGPGNSEIRTFLKRKFADYMIPSAFVALDSIPLKPNGKVDIQALPAPAYHNLGDAARILHYRNPLEEMLAHIWSQALGIEQVGADDNFFEVGGDSLLAIRILSQLRRRFQVVLNLETFINTPTIAQLAMMLEGAVPEAELHKFRNRDGAGALSSR
jgi:amino acid adenylation domain-containing protein